MGKAAISFNKFSDIKKQLVTVYRRHNLKTERKTALG